VDLIDDTFLDWLKISGRKKGRNSSSGTLSGFIEDEIWSKGSGSLDIESMIMWLVDHAARYWLLIN
jgi:hypothetical protein